MDECETCVYYPPSCLDGKPCCVCDPSDPLLNCYQERKDLYLWQRLSTLVLNVGLTLSIWFYAHILQKAKSGALVADGLIWKTVKKW